MERLEARGAPFRSIYFRRAGILLIFGWLHFFLLFSWDVLHVYGIAAFILLFSRKLSARTMLVVGGALLLFAKPLISGVFEWSGVSVTLDAITSADSEVLARQAAAQSGDFVTFMGFDDIGIDRVNLALVVAIHFAHDPVLYSRIHIQFFRFRSVVV